MKLCKQGERKHELESNCTRDKRIFEQMRLPIKYVRLCRKLTAGLVMVRLRIN